MNELLHNVNALVEASRAGGREIGEVSLSDRQWKTICKDKRRLDWRIPRACGFIHYGKQMPEYNGIRLKPPTPSDLRDYCQIDAFQDAGRGR